jgi:hypothetical protein
MSKIELRLSNVDPPATEPKRTIYRDIANLPDPVKLGITIRYFNHDDVDLYFQITGSGTGYTFGTVNLGLLASGANAYINLDEFASRAKPSASDLPNGEMEENITLTLKAYTDASYSDLKWTFERVVTVHWINSADASFTVDELDNFDDGTVQGWATGGDVAGSIAAGTDYVLSSPYSLKKDVPRTGGVPATFTTNLYKQFTTPNKDKVFAIINLRYKQKYVDTHYTEEIIKYDGTTLIYISYPPLEKWIRYVVPLPKNTTLTLTIEETIYSNSSPDESWLWMDDFKIISK